jgi:hypothetical protein
LLALNPLAPDGRPDDVREHRHGFSLSFKPPAIKFVVATEKPTSGGGGSRRNGGCGGGGGCRRNGGGGGRRSLGGGGSRHGDVGGGSCSGGGDGCGSSDDGLRVAPGDPAPAVRRRQRAPQRRINALTSGKSLPDKNLFSDPAKVGIRESEEEENAGNQKPVEDARATSKLANANTWEKRHA